MVDQAHVKVSRELALVNEGGLTRQEVVWVLSFSLAYLLSFLVNLHSHLNISHLTKLGDL
ncbi:hypothetical protein D3C84_978730 [compost metagenome]